MNKDLIYSKSPAWLQTLLLNAYAYSLHKRRYGKRFRQLADEFKTNETLSLGDLTSYQNEKLRALIEYSYEFVPYYHNCMKSLKLSPRDIKGQEDLFKLPLLTRTDIKRNFSSLKSKEIPEKQLLLGHTSGTTGSPLEFYWDNSVEIIHHVADWRQKGWAGLDFGDRYASMQGRTIVSISAQKPPFWKTNYVNNQLFLSSFHLNKENIHYYIDKLTHFNPRVIEGYPSTLYILAKYLLAKQVILPLKAALTSSETLFPIQREAIEQAFDCKVFDFYGMAERVVYASECEIHCGQHLNLDYGVTEILDEKKQPVAVGEMGRIVATGLWNFGMPLIRYVTSDTTALSPAKCGCNREFPLMKNVTTKDEDIVTTPDGRLISSSILTHSFKPMQNILESQIIQENLETVVVKIVKKSEYSDEDSVRLISSLTERLGQDVTVKLEFVDSISRTKNGKFRWVVSKVPLEF